MKLLKYTGENYAVLKQQVEQQYQKDLATLSLAKDNQMKDLLKHYDTPADLTIKYVEVITKKSRLSHHKRELVESLFGPLVKSTAIDIINERNKKEETCKSNSPASQTQPSTK